MAILTAKTLEFEEEASSDILAEIAPNTILMVISDAVFYTHLDVYKRQD